MSATIRFYRLALIFALSASHLCSQQLLTDGKNAIDANVPLRITTSTRIGVLYGDARELVYGAGIKISDLDWTLKPLTYWGAMIRLETTSGYYCSASLKAGLSGFSGTMTDSDYLNLDGVRTHLSAHDCYTEDAFLFDAAVGYENRVSPSFSMGWALIFASMHFKWTARDGYLQYPSETSSPYTPWDASMAKTYVYGTGMAYEQNFLIPGVGFSVKYMPTPPLSIRLALDYSPLAACNDLDNHFLRALDFIEIMRNGSYFKPSLRAEYSKNGATSFWLEGSFTLVGNLLGNTKMIDTATGDTTTYKDSGGASLSILDIGIGFSARL